MVTQSILPRPKFITKMNCSAAILYNSMFGLPISSAIISHWLVKPMYYSFPSLKFTNSHRMDIFQAGLALQKKKTPVS